ncbi:type II secretion system F family protein [Rhodopirellula sp. JC639]|uniref:type II secretion system F family protein n=1 Tax=Stieleria mannarensis TaxID=2755585 RepID=UPI001604112C|nr:type II secretion system F family protein [Rhodopirellula sp. JC639]
MSTASGHGGARAITGNQHAESQNLFKTLHEIKFGNDPQRRFKRKDLILFLRNLTTLVQNGVSLTHALETVTRDRSLKKYHHILSSISRALKGGESLSTAMKAFPSAFNVTLISQIEVGERSGALDQALVRVTEQLERSSGHRKMILKKLAYPAILVVAGTGSVTFMLLYVIPTFQQMYEDAGATLPAITQLLIDSSVMIQNYGVHLLGLIIVLAVAVVTLFRNVQSRRWIDRNLIRIPVIGDWFRNLAILQFADVLGNLMESGFTLAEALPPAGRAIGNRHVREKILGLYTAIRRGERFSQSLEREGDLFPAVVNQLVIVGERTGRLVPVTHQIRKHLRRDVEDSTDALVGAIEPILTIVLAVAVGGILLAVYLPMFDLIGKVNH